MRRFFMKQLIQTWKILCATLPWRDANRPLFFFSFILWYVRMSVLFFYFFLFILLCSAFLFFFPFPEGMFSFFFFNPEYAHHMITAGSRLPGDQLMYGNQSIKRTCISSWSRARLHSQRSRLLGTCQPIKHSIHRVLSLTKKYIAVSLIFFLLSTYGSAHPSLFAVVHRRLSYTAGQLMCADRSINLSINQIDQFINQLDHSMN